MNLISKKIIASFTLLIMITGCTKSDTAVSQTDQLKTILTAKMWKLSSTVMITTSGNVNQTIATCRLDDLWEYKADGSFARYPGTNKCSTSDLTNLGTWQLVNNDAGLKIVLSTGNYTDEIVTLDATKLQLKYATGTASYIDTYIPN
jgi:hypothetical protein